jgi:Periplasmic binding protein
MSFFGAQRGLRLVGGSLITAAALLVSGLGLSVPAGAATHGSPYTVQFNITESGTSAQFPESPAVVKAAFHGTSATVVDCDDQGTATGNLDCDHQAVENHVAVVIEGTSNEDQTVLAAAGIPILGVTNDTSSDSFDLSAAQSFFVGMAVAEHNKGCKRMGVVIDEGGQPEAAQVAKAEKWQSVTDAYIPLTSSDVSAEIAKLAQAKVQCISMASLGTQIPQILTAIKQAGLKVPIAIPGVILNPQIVSSLGALGNGLIEIVSTPDPAAHAAAVAKVTKEIHAIDPSAKVTGAALDAWAWSKVVQDAAATIHGPATSASMLKALNKLRNAKTDGLNPPLSMIPRPNAADRRDFDTNVLTYVLKNGKATGAGTFLNVGTQLDAATR